MLTGDFFAADEALPRLALVVLDGMVQNGCRTSNASGECRQKLEWKTGTLIERSVLRKKKPLISTFDRACLNAPSSDVKARKRVTVRMYIIQPRSLAETVLLFVANNVLFLPRNCAFSLSNGKPSSNDAHDIPSKTRLTNAQT